MKDGTLPGTVFSLTQTTGGDLWIGTEVGLLRFDGVRFLRWRAPAGQPLPDEYIIALASASDGSLWIGTRAGLSHWTGEKVENFPTSKGPAGPHVTAIAAGRGGGVWAGTAGYQSGELCRVDGHALHCYGEADGLPGRGVLSLHEGRSGDLWVGAVGGLCRWGHGAFEVFKLPQPLAMIYSIAEDRHGEIWTATSGQDSLMRLRDGRLVPYPVRAAPRGTHAFTLLRDRDGGLWIGTAGQGLVHFHEGRMDRFTRADGLSSDIVRSLFEDKEGNVWAATNGGLDRFREFPVTTLSEREGLSNNAVGSVFASKYGGIWVGTDGGLDRVQDARTTAYGEQNGLPSSIVHTIFEDRDGRLWVNSGSALSFFANGRFHTIAGKFGLIAAAAEDRDGNVWFSVPGQGLIRVRDGSIAEVVPWRKFGDNQARALESDLEGDGLWLGFTGGGIAWYRHGQPIHFFTSSDGLGRGLIGDLHAARDGTLWAATQGGLSRLRDGHIATLTEAGALPCDDIQSMVEDDNHALWLNTACGLIRIAASELAAWSANPKHKISTQLYGAAEGMRVRPTSFGSFRSATKSKDGRLWFAVMDGVAVVDPQRIAKNRLPPPVRIEQITADKIVYPTKSHFSLPPRTRELQIDYTAFSFVAPEKMRFRYRLDGFETDWHDAGARRQAVYTNLPPQQYHFQVVACNNDGVWNEVGAALDFSVRPAYYQTTWFRFLCAVAFALSLWGLYLLRVRQLSARLRFRFEERMAERTRISRELHDTLLQNITGFALQLDALSKTVAGPTSVRERLRDLREQAEEWLREARESVSNLRRPIWGGEDLAAALRMIGQQITAGSEVRFHMTVSGRRRAASPEVQENLLRIIQEAARNSVRHGHATEILVYIQYSGRDRVRVAIRDDGCGFDPDEASDKMGHWGLMTMRERAKEIGAKLTISAVPGHGTTIEIVAQIHLRRDTQVML